MKTIYVKIVLIQILLLLGHMLQAQTYSFVKEISGYTQQPIVYELMGPRNMANDAQGNVYIIEGNSSIVKVDASGNFLSRWSVANNITLQSLRIDASGNLLMTDFNSNRVLKYSPTGQLLQTWGSTGTGNGQFGVIRDLAIDQQGNIYVSDQTNNCIQKFTSAGVFVIKWGSAGTGNGQFNSPLFLDVDGNGNVYVRDYNNNRIQKFTSAGVFISQWSVGTDADFAIDKITNTLYILPNTSNPISWVSKYNANGSYIGAFQVPLADGVRITCIHIDGNGNVFLADQGSHVYKYTNTGTYIATWGSSGANGQFYQTSGVAKDNLGYTYVIDNGYRVQKFNPTGVYVGQWGTFGSGNGQFSYACGIAIDANNNVYVMDMGNSRVQKFTIDGVYITQWGGYGYYDYSNSPYSRGAFALALDASANVYVADGPNLRVTKHSSNGTLITTWGGTFGNGDGQFTDPRGIAVDASGYVYVSDRSGRIQKFTSSGTFVSKWGTAGSGNGQFSELDAICVDVSGNIFAVDKGNARVQKFNSSGTFLTSFGTYGLETGKFRNMLGVYADNAGSVYIGDYGRVSIFAPPAPILTGVPSTSVCQGQSIAITCTAQSTFTTGNTFIAHLSDPTGSFSSGTTVIGTLSSTTSGIINATIPANAAPGNKYRIRIMGSVPYTVGADNGADITINYRPAIGSMTGPVSVCANQTEVNYTINNHTGSTYVWSVPTGATVVGSGNNIKVNFATTSGQVSVTETNGTCNVGVSSTAVQVKPKPTNTLTVSSPSFACPQDEGLTFTVTNAAAFATYNWTVPTGAVITSGANTAQIIVRWGGGAGTVSVSETNTCGTGAINSVSVASSAKYALGDVSVLCGTSLCVPLQTIGNINPGLIGLDYVINYDPALLTPSTLATVGPVATSYGDYRLNTATPGKVFVSVFLKNAPSNTFFSGAGTVLCVNFTAKANGPNTGRFTTDQIEESGQIGSATVCQAVPSELKVTGVVGGKIIYRANTNNNLGYYAMNPALYLPTSITGYGNACAEIPGSKVLPNNDGIFAFNPDHGPSLRLERNIKGDLNVPAIECANVQAVINSTDWSSAAAIANYGNTSPSIYELLSADVNLDGKVTAGDVSLISSRSVNTNNCEFPQAWNYRWTGTAYVAKIPYNASKDWLFIDDATLNSAPFTAGFNRNNVPQVPTCLLAPTGTAACTPLVTATYHAILLGDVNGNWSRPNHAAQTREFISGEIFFDLPNAIVNGTTKTIPVYYAGEPTFQGIDFSMDYGSDITVNSLTAADGVSLQWNNIDNRRLMVSANANEALTGNYPVLYLTVTTNEALTAQSFSSASGYLNGEEANLRFDASAANVGSGINAELFPNPSNGTTYLYATDAAAFVKLSIYTSNGMLVYENAHVPANENTALPELKNGVYILKVSGSNGETTKKLVRY